MADSDAAGPAKEGGPEVGRLTRAVIRCPGLISCGILSLATLLSMVALLLVIFTSNDFGDAVYFSELRPLDDPVIKRSLALTELTADRFLSEEAEEDRKESEDPDRDEDERSVVRDTLRILYEDLASTQSMLTKANVEKMATVERAVLELDWEDVCLRVYSVETNSSDEGKGRCASPDTVLNYLYVDDDKHEDECKDGFCLIDKDLLSLCGDAAYPWGQPPCVSLVYDWRDGDLVDEDDFRKELRRRLCDNEFLSQVLLDKDSWECDDDPIASQYVRSRYRVGWPYDGYKNTDDREEEQEALLQAELLLSDPTKYGTRRRFALAMAADPLSATNTEDRNYVGEPVGTETINVLWQDFLALRFPDTAIFDQFTSFLSLFFVFCYLWFNVGSYIIALAGVTEIVLSLPLAYTFYRVVMWQTRIDTIFFNSLYLIICIGSDDIFVFMDTWKKSLTMPEAISGSLETRLAWTYRRSARAMATTTATTVLSLLLTASSSLPALRAFGVFASLVVLFDYILVISWLPCVVVWYAKNVERCCPACGPCCKVREVTPGQKLDEGPAVLFLRDKAAPFIRKWRFVFLAVALATTVALTTTLGVLFEEAEDLPSIFVPQHQFSVFDDLDKDEFFQPEAGDYAITVVYGVSKEDPFTIQDNGQINPLSDPDVDTTVNFVPLDLTEDLQEEIVKDCDNAKDRKDSSGDKLVDDDEVYCVLNLLKDNNKDDFPYKDEKKLLDALKDLYKSSTYGDLIADIPDYDTRTGFVVSGDDDIVALWNSFNTTIPTNIPTSSAALAPFFNAWEAYAEEECAAQCWQYLPASRDRGADWSIFTILERLTRETGLTILLCLICAFVVIFVSTQNYIISALVLTTIACAVVCVMASVFAAGLTFGPNEALYIVITIGLSIDYAVHLSHFYAESQGDRYEKARGALSEIGISVVGGATTTVIAGLPLFFSQFLTQFLFGFFLFFTALWAFFMSMVLLIPLLMTIGPEGDTGDVRTCLPERCSREAGKGGAEPDGGTSTTA